MSETTPVHETVEAVTPRRRVMNYPDWQCPHCHVTMKVNAKGSHLSACKLNPDRARRPKRDRHAQVPCDYCHKTMAKASLRQHIDRYCSVATAIREGRLLSVVPVVPVPQPPTPISDTLPFTSDEEHIQVGRLLRRQQEETILRRAEAERRELLDTFDETTARSVLEMAIDEILDDRPVSFSIAGAIVDDVHQLIKDLRRAWPR